MLIMYCIIGKLSVPHDYLILHLSIFKETELKLPHEVVSINVTPVNLYVKSIPKLSNSITLSNSVKNSACNCYLTPCPKAWVKRLPTPGTVWKN